MKSYLQRITEQRQKAYHNKKYIYWKNCAEKHKLKHEDFENKILECIKLGYKKVFPTTIRKDWVPNSYSLLCKEVKSTGKPKSTISMCIYDGVNYYYYYTDARDDNKNIDEKDNTMSIFKDKFEERTGTTLLNNFGAVSQDYKKLVPLPLYYISNEFAKEKWINNVSKEDYSSQFPSCAMGILPTSIGSVELDGYYGPTEEYPFAFYPDSGHIAIYNEFDTHNYKRMIEAYSAKSESYEKDETKWIANYNNKDTKTILMKKANYSLEEFEYFYNLKNNYAKGTKEYNDAKLLMNKTIGKFHQNNPMFYFGLPFAHVSSVIKWRANIKMFHTLIQIGEYNIIQVIVDGIIHKGKPIGTYEKKLGNLIIEYNNAKFIQRGINAYIIKSTSNEERFHAGFDTNISKDITEWEASPKVNWRIYTLKTYKVDIKEIKYE